MPNMLVFKSVTTIEFKSAEDLEAVLRQMPWQPHEVVSVLEGGTFTDTEDKVDYPGAGKVTHEFSVEGEE